LDHFVSNPLESPFGQALALLKGLRILDLSRILAGHGEFQSSWGCDTCIFLLKEDIQTTPEMGREHPAFFGFASFWGTLHLTNMFETAVVLKFEMSCKTIYGSIGIRTFPLWVGCGVRVPRTFCNNADG